MSEVPYGAPTDDAWIEDASLPTLKRTHYLERVFGEEPPQGYAEWIKSLSLTSVEMEYFKRKLLGQLIDKLLITGVVPFISDLPQSGNNNGDIWFVESDGHAHLWLDGNYYDLGDLKGVKGDKGDQGIQGNPGVDGIDGEVGPQGEQGIPGPKGDTGLTGAKGDTGSQGIQGERGLTGPTGPKGDKGDTGEKGDQGIQGERGLQGIKGDKGDQGIQGIPGNDGADGTSVSIKGTVASIAELPATGNTNGDGWITSNDGHLHVWTDTAFIDVGLVRGPKGDKGDTGAQGIQGIQGIPGEKGDRGLQGIQGVKGDTGDQGPIGLTGPKGDQGLQGIQGIQGIKGDQGVQGPTGPKGDKGDKGDSGVVYRNPLFSDPPSAFVVGTTVGNGTSANGWQSALVGFPVSAPTVITFKALNVRAVQIYYNAGLEQNSYTRTAQDGDVWGPFRDNFAKATSSLDGLLPKGDKAKLDSATTSNHPNTLVMRASNGRTNLGSIAIANAPTSIDDATRKDYVDNHEIISPKTALEGTETYPMGTSMFYNGTTDTSWPIIRGNVVTQRTAVNRAHQIIYNASVSSGTRAFIREGDGLGGWGSFEEYAFKSYVDQKVADPNVIKNGQEGVVYAANYGAEGAIVGDGVNNDYWTIQRAINAGKEVVLEGGKTYLIGGTLSMPSNGRRSVSIRATGAKPAILKLGAIGQNYSAIKFENNDVAATTTLRNSVPLGATSIPVGSTTGVEEGMICELVSSKLWYFDNRDLAAKSELHKVRKVNGSQLVEFYDPLNDGYNVSAGNETVTLKFYKPIHVTLDNLHIQGTHVPVAEETNAVIGVEISHADTPKLTNVSTEQCARTGLYMLTCYSPKITGGYDNGSNNYWNGYGVSISGCANAHVKDREAYNSRRPVDVTGAVVISRNTVIENCRAYGGGMNSRGDWYGWNPDGTAGAYQGGFGTHGGCDQLSIIDCHTFGIGAPIIARGRDISVINHRHIGNTTGPVIQCSTGTNIFVQGGTVSAGYWGHKHSLTHQTGNYAGIISKRPSYFLRIYPAYQENESGFHGRVIVKGVTAELKNIFIYFDNNAPVGHFSVHDNDVFFATDPGTGDAALLWYSGTAPAINKKHWFIGPNQLSRDNGPGGILQSYNISLSGANVIDYTTKP